MTELYQEDLAYIQAVAFADFARGAAPEILRRLQSATIPVHQVVDLGCGAGPLTAALLEAGFQAIGIDSSKELLAIARANAPTARFVQASLYEAKLPRCEAILAVGEPLTYHEDSTAAEDLVLRLFRRSAAVLPTGGVFIFDVIEQGQPPLTGRSWAAGEDWAVLISSLEDPRAQTLTRDIETFRRIGQMYRRGHERHAVRVFETDNLCRGLEESGFAVETARTYGTYQLPARRLALFATKRK